MFNLGIFGLKSDAPMVPQRAESMKYIHVITFIHLLQNLLALVSLLHRTV